MVTATPYRDIAGLDGDNDGIACVSLPWRNLSQMLTNPDAFTALESGPLYRFADWPVAAVPGTAGVYTIWDTGGRFIYTGMAGRGVTAVGEEQLVRPTRGLWGRLSSHASGRRSSDQFCVYVGDRLVLPELQPDQIAQIGSGMLSFDTLIRNFIRQELSFRFIQVADGQLALDLERQVQRGALPSGRPFLNPLPEQ